MPYTIDKPPDAIKTLPKHAQEIWIAAFNAASSKYKQEAPVFAISWAAVRTRFRQDANGKWIAKSDYGDFIMTEAKKILPESWYAKIQQAARAYAGGKAYKPNREHDALMKLSPETLTTMKDAQIEKLHARAHTLHKCTPTTSDVHSVGYVKLKNLKKFHGWLAKEMSRRQMAHDMADELDSNMIEKYSDDQPRDEAGRFGGGGGGSSSAPSAVEWARGTRAARDLGGSVPQRAVNEADKILQREGLAPTERKLPDKDQIKHMTNFYATHRPVKGDVWRTGKNGGATAEIISIADNPRGVGVLIDYNVITPKGGRVSTLYVTNPVWKSDKSFDVTFIAKADEQQIAYGVVYEPDTVDSQGDWASAAEIEKAAHRFLELYRQMDVNHDGNVRQDIVPVESYLAPVDFEMGEPPQKILKGSWIVGVHAGSPETWQDIKSDKLSGLSMFGLAHRKDGAPGVAIATEETNPKAGDGLAKYSDDQPRDEQGRFGVGGGGSGGGSPSGGKIESVKRWVGKDKEVRIYAHAPDGREGTRYITGNRFQAKGTVTGQLTTDEWAEVKEKSFDPESKKWLTWPARPVGRYNAEDPESEAYNDYRPKPRNATAAEIAELRSRVGSVKI